MNKTLKTILCIVLALCAILLVYKIYDGIMEPVRFNKEVEARKKVAVQRLKDIRDLQVAFKSVNEKFTASFDTLKQFYNNGQWDRKMTHLPWPTPMRSRSLTGE